MLRRQARRNADGQVIAVKDAMADQHARWLAMLQAQMVPIYRWIYTNVGNREQAEALTTRVFDQVARERAPQNPTSEVARERLLLTARMVVAGELHAFYGAAAGAALDGMRRISVEDMETMSDEAGRAKQAAVHAHNLLSRLPTREREVLTCRFLLGYPIERTAAQLDLSVAETMALQFVALTHASRLDAVSRATEGEDEDEDEDEDESAGQNETSRVAQTCCPG